jgi:hypothetical protein
VQDAEPETEPETGHNGKQSPLAMELERNREAMAAEAGTKSPRAMLSVPPSPPPAHTHHTPPPLPPPTPPPERAMA